MKDNLRRCEFVEKVTVFIIKVDVFNWNVYGTNKKQRDNVNYTVNVEITGNIIPLNIKLNYGSFTVCLDTVTCNLFGRLSI